MNIYPAIDIRGGKCVRLLQGDYSKQLDYHEDPVAVALQFGQLGARWLHVIDLDAAKVGSPQNLDVIERIIQQSRLNVQVGGGLRSDDAIARVLGAGARRAIIGTAALENWDWFQEVVHSRDNHGRIALALDARAGRLAAKGWTETTSRTAPELGTAITDWPIAAIIYTDIERDGMLAGPNLQATAALAEATSVPVIASGGIGTIDHVRQLTDLPIAGMVIGRAIYEKTVDLNEALAAADQASG
jgi:phosphoribosylformimino-5-aminoimidazole carboxamide ribotide isomerase